MTRVEFSRAEVNAIMFDYVGKTRRGHSGSTMTLDWQTDGTCHVSLWPTKGKLGRLVKEVGDSESHTMSPDERLWTLIKRSGVVFNETGKWSGTVEELRALLTLGEVNRLSAKERAEIPPGHWLRRRLDLLKNRRAAEAGGIWTLALAEGETS